MFLPTSPLARRSKHKLSGIADYLAVLNHVKTGRGFDERMIS